MRLTGLEGLRPSADDLKESYEKSNDSFNDYQEQTKSKYDEHHDTLNTSHDKMSETHDAFSSNVDSFHQNADAKHFQPMNVDYGLFPALEPERATFVSKSGRRISAQNRGSFSSFSSFR
mgnify:CR=1 FL=1